jgi:hypothetical protein
MIAAPSAGSAAETGLPNSIDRDRHLPAGPEILYVALDRTIVDRALDCCPNAAQEALPIGETLATSVQSSIDDLHRTS